MLPTLGSVGPFTFYSFGLLAAIAIIMAGVVIAVDMRQRGLDPGGALEIVVAAVFGGFIGGRLYYVVEHWGEPGETIISGSGLAWYGGLAGGAVGVTLVSAWRRMPIGLTANLIAAPLALAYALGRIGCQLAGDGDYGPPTDLPWGMSYPDGTAPTDLVVHPTSLYEAAAMLVVFWVLWRMRGRLAAPWALFGLYLLLAGLERFLAEFVSANPKVILGMSMAQTLSIVLIIGGAVVLWIQRGRHDPARVADASTA